MSVLIRLCLVSFFNVQYSDRLPHPEISYSLYLSKFGRLICGQSDGSIVVLSATQAATRLLLEERKISKGEKESCFTL